MSPVRGKSHTREPSKLHRHGWSMHAGVSIAERVVTADYFRRARSIAVYLHCLRLREVDTSILVSAALHKGGMRAASSPCVTDTACGMVIHSETDVHIGWPYWAGSTAQSAGPTKHHELTCISAAAENARCYVPRVLDRASNMDLLHLDR